MTQLLCALCGVLPFGGEARPEVRWVNPAEGAIRRPQPVRAFDRTIADPALGGVTIHSGDAVIAFHLRGRYFIELFLTVREDGRDSFVLLAGERVLDDRNGRSSGPGRMRPKPGTRRINLLAMADGPATLTVRTKAERYGLAALRWTPAPEFESRLAPGWRDRARWLQSHALFEGEEGGPMARRGYLEQLYQRLSFSADAAMRKEALLGLTRTSYWAAMENHEPADLERTAELFGECLRAAPQDPLVRQMISAWCGASNTGRAPQRGDFCGAVEPVPWPVAMPRAPARAPQWALEQRRLKYRLDAITRWWVEKRQQPNGEIGGGWGDDVEILRQWTPLALGLGSSVAALGIERMANGIWSSGQLVDGYNKDIRDVEHSAEPSTDTLPLLAALHPDDPEPLRRLRMTAECARHWIARQPDGFFRFRSSWYTCREHDSSPERAVDVYMNARALGPALWHTYFTGDRAVTRLLEAWAESWLEAMRSTAHGKPAGLIPSALRSQDGSYLVNSLRWDKPDAEWDYFQWSPGSQASLALLFLAVHDLTGQRRWLDAAGESFQPRDARLREAPDAFLEWRRRTGNGAFDSFFGWEPKSDGQLLEQMAREAREMEQRLAVNFDMHTSEVLYTDRVYYRMPATYSQALTGGEAPRGDRYPTFAVTWLPSREDFARAVLHAAPDSLRLRAFNFESGTVRARFRAWRLQTGSYRWRAAEETGTFQVTGRPTLLEIPLPPGREVRIEIDREPEEKEIHQ